MYEDPRKQIQRDVILAECARRGIRLEQKGQAYLLTGPGVYVLAADLALLSETDLHAFVPRTEKQARA